MKLFIFIVMLCANPNDDSTCRPDPSIRSEPMLFKTEEACVKFAEEYFTAAGPGSYECDEAWGA